MEDKLNSKTENKLDLPKSPEASSDTIIDAPIEKEKVEKVEQADKLDSVDDSKKEKKKLKIYRKKLKETKEALKKQEDKYAFLNAELENMRKHLIKQKSLAEKHSVNRTLTQFAPLIDSFESAFELKNGVKEAPGSECVGDFIKGFEHVYTQLKDIFNSFGLKVIDQTGIEFDYRIHEVMMRSIDDNQPEDTVISILQKGYERNGEVIRPAKVVVTKKTPPPKPEPPKPEPPQPEPPQPEKLEITEPIKPEEKKTSDLDSTESKAK